MVGEHSSDDLKEEIEYFGSHRTELLERYKNLFVLIKGSELVGAFPDAETAYQEGISKFELQPFLVRQVLEEEPINISHLITILPQHARS